jgi:ankyrin repeat protein
LVAEKLIECGADINSEDGNGQTALFYCAREGHKEMCLQLLKKGANVNKQDKKHQTALHWAKKHNRQEVIFYLIM